MWRKRLFIILPVLIVVLSIPLAIAVNAYSNDLPPLLRGHGTLAALVVVVLAIVIATLTGIQYQIAAVDTTSPAPPPERLIVRGREKLLRNVENRWISTYLGDSLRGIVPIQISLSYAFRAVEGAWRGLDSGYHDQPSKPASIRQAFDESGESLLILGPPGSGKTTQMLSLLAELLTEATRDTDRTVPVVLHLSSYPPQRSSFASWVITGLTGYRIDPKVAAALLESSRISVLADGLDSLPRGELPRVMAHINEFHQNYSGIPLLVCCRSEDYEFQRDKLRLGGAVMVEPLQRDSVRQYLATEDPDLRRVKGVLDQDASIYQLVTSPLMLALVIRTYKEEGPTDGSNAAVETHPRLQLFEAYLGRMLNSSRTTTKPSRRELAYQAKGEAWLAWLARGMQQDHQTTFYPGLFEPSWTPTPRQTQISIWVVVITVRVFTPIVVAVIASMYWGLLGALVYFLLYVLISMYTSASAQGLVIQIFRIAGRLPYGVEEEWSKLFISESEKMESVDKFSVSHSGPVFWLCAWVLTSFGDILLGGVGARLLARSFHGLLYGLFGAIGIGLLLAMLVALTRRLIPVILPISIYGAVLGFLLGYVFESFLRREHQWVALGFAVGAAAGLFNGLVVLGTRLLHRGWLVSANVAPWRYVDFLEFARQRQVMYKAGDGYVFMHPTMQEFLAAKGGAPMAASMSDTDLPASNAWSVRARKDDIRLPKIAMRYIRKVLRDEALEEGRKSERTRHFDVSLKAYTKAIHFDPESADVYFARARIYVQTGQLEAARGDIRRALELYNWGSKTDPVLAAALTALLIEIENKDR